MFDFGHIEVGQRRWFKEPGYFRRILAFFVAWQVFYSSEIWICRQRIDLYANYAGTVPLLDSEQVLRIGIHSFGIEFSGRYLIYDRDWSGYIGGMRITGQHKGEYSPSQAESVS